MIKKRGISSKKLEQRLLLDASLPIAGAVAWYDAADAATVLDADGDDAATGTGGNNDGFGGSVATWQDKSGSDFHVTGAPGEQPLYGTDTQNGNNVLTFDGVNDRLTDNGTIAGDDVTMFVVYNRTAITGRDGLVELGSGGSRNAPFLFADNQIQYYANGGFHAGTGTFATGQYHLGAFIHDTTSIEGWMNGTNFLSSTGSARATTNAITIGDDVTSGDEITGTIAEFIVYDRDLTNDERHDVETYLAGKWGLTSANTAPTLDTNTGLTLDEGTSLGIANTNLAGSDADNTDGNLVYEITNAVDNGTLTNTNTSLALGLGDTFKQSDLDNGYITYTHNGSSTTTDSFEFTLTDCQDDVTAQTFNITVNPVGTFADVNAITNPVLHFDATDIDGDGDTSDQPADGSQVSQWRDNRGSSLDHASASGSGQPVYDANGFSYASGGITFDGVNERLTMSSDNEVNNSSYAEKSFALTFRTGSDVASDQIIYEQGGTTNGISFGIFGGDIYAYTYRGGSGGTHYAINLGVAATDTTYQLIASYDHNVANTWSANLNGGAFSSMAVNSDIPGHSGAPGFGRDNGNTLHPVTNNSTSSNYFEGAIGEFWSWNKALTGAEIDNIEDYFQDKWFDTPHSITTNTALSVPEDAVISIPDTNLETSDVESPDEFITYTLTSLPTQGTLYRSGVALGLNDIFTQDDMVNDRLTFDHDGTAAPDADSFNFTVTDGFNTGIAGTFNFTIVTAPPTEPILVTNTLLTLDEGASATITDAFLDTDDGNTADNAITYTVTDLPDNGTLFLNSGALNVSDTFTQEDITNSLLTYTHDDSEVFTDAFTFTVSDGTTTLSSANFSFAINPVNDQTPTNITISSNNVDENSSNGTVIGTFSTIDADLPGDTFSYSIIADPDSKFQIVGDELRVNDSLNHENDIDHSVTVRVNDGTFTYDRTFMINVNDINENPTDITLSNNNIDENTAIGTVIGTLGGSDPDVPADTLTFTVFNDPDNKFQIVGNQLQVGGDVNFEAQNSHSVTVRVSDGNGGTYNESFTVNLNDVNDAPVASVTEALVGQGNMIVLSGTELSATDEDNVDASLSFTLTALPANGLLALDGTNLGVGDSFTQQNIIDGDVTYTHDNAPGNTDNFSFTVNDGTATTAATLTITIRPSQDNFTPTSVNEGGDGAVQSANLSYGSQGGDTTPWFDTNWAFRQQITVDSSLISSDLTDFSLLLTEAGMSSNFWGNIQSNGADIVITAGDGVTQLDRELVSLDTVGETVQLYTRTDLSSTVDTNLYIYYGNAAAAETNAATAWRSEYTGVWHFDDDFDDGDVADSSQAANDGFTRNGFSSGNQAGGVIGSAGEFNNNEYLALNYNYSGNNTLPEVSVSAWINTTVSGGGQNTNWAILDFDRSEFFNVYIHGDGRVSFSTAGSGLSVDDFYSDGTTVNDGNWHHVAAVYDGTDKILYVDGAEVARDTSTYGGAALGKSTRYGFIGDGSEAGSFDSSRNNLYYEGLYDNIRLYEGTFSDAWISAEYQNQVDPSSFYTVGSEQIGANGLTYQLTDLPDNGVLYLDANLNALRDAGEALAINDTYTQEDIDNLLLRYEHDGGETTSDQISFTVTDTFGITTTIQTYDFTIIPDNDAPTDIILSKDFVSETLETGETVANLNTVDVDLPGDTMTYTILSDPDGRFAISGSQLILASALDFETQEQHNVTIQVNDGLATFDRTFTISVTDEFEGDLNLTQRELADATFETKPIEEDRRRSGFFVHNQLLSSANANAAPIIYEYVIEDIQQSAEKLLVREKNDLADNILLEGIQSGPENKNVLPENPAQQPMTNLRAAAKFLSDMDSVSGVNEEPSDIDASASDENPLSQIEQKFEDVLTYHEQKQARLRAALLS